MDTGVSALRATPMERYVYYGPRPWISILFELLHTFKLKLIAVHIPPGQTEGHRGCRAGGTWKRGQRDTEGAELVGRGKGESGGRGHGMRSEPSTN